MAYCNRLIVSIPALLLFACVPAKGDLGEYTASTTVEDTTTTGLPVTTGTTADEPGTVGTGGPETTSTSDASSSGEPPENTSTSDDSSATDSPPEVQHPACSAPFPAVAPALPPINWGPDERPRFDDWRDLGCEELDATSCEKPDNGPCGTCLKGVEDGPGVCTTFDIDIWCDGEGEALGYGEGTCWTCAPLAARAFACCNFPEGFDCRAWPYPSDGPPGSICARHEDCEPGLVCGAHLGEGYGICQCPGLASEDVVPPQSCFQ